MMPSCCFHPVPSQSHLGLKVLQRNLRTGIKNRSPQFNHFILLLCLNYAKHCGNMSGYSEWNLPQCSGSKRFFATLIFTSIFQWDLYPFFYPKREIPVNWGAVTFLTLSFGSWMCFETSSLFSHRNHPEMLNYFHLVYNWTPPSLFYVSIIISYVLCGAPGWAWI